MIQGRSSGVSIAWTARYCQVRTDVLRDHPLRERHRRGGVGAGEVAVGQGDDRLGGQLHDPDGTASVIAGHSAGSRRRPCRAPSGASCAAWSGAGRRRRCRGCGRSRAAGSARAGRRRRTSTGSPSRPVPVTDGEVGAGALDERAGEGQAALVVGVEVAVAALGQGEHRVADDADGALPGLVGAVEDEHRDVLADLAGGQADAVGGVHRRDHVGGQRRAAPRRTP